MDYDQLKKEIDSIVEEYLSIVYRCFSNIYNEKNINVALKSDSFNAFELINSPGENQLLLNLEREFEGCIRVFLINPIINCLFKSHNINIEWEFETTFSKYSISTREYENNSFLEFIISYKDKKIGYRYTPLSYTIGDEPSVIYERNNEYLCKHKSIPGFNRLSPIDTIFIINWTNDDDSSMLLEKESKYMKPRIKTCNKNVISIKDFFNTYFKNYDLFISIISDAIKKARRICALQAKPKLNNDNMFIFKQNVACELLKSKIENKKYIFKNNKMTTISESDLSILNSYFYSKKLYKALIGDEDFAKCFITAEYLFKMIDDGISIDYTSIVVGYLKSVEQLLYKYYISAFNGKERLSYWDKCRKPKDFNDSLCETYRYDPYDKRKQEYYSHKKKRIKKRQL